uniref:Ig-like domain-containing protein n=1 Tax=Equus asinus TaxID=9793 RepID=A0A9L0I8V9_EQUAS
MLWICPLFHLAVFCAGVSVDIILEPVTKTLIVLAGETATFRCNITGGDLKNYRMSWYKKNEDNSLTLVYGPRNNSNDDLRKSFKGEINILKNQYILDIQKATTKDVGTYYCGSDTHIDAGKVAGAVAVSILTLGLAATQ